MESLFDSYFLGGFECSCHLHQTTRRNLTAATGHDEFALQDYARLGEIGIRTARDGISWPAIETRPGYYDFSSAMPMLRAALATGTQVIWDLFHYGWPDEIDLFSGEFTDRFVRFCRAFAKVLNSESGEVPFYAPLNEISFFAWAVGGEATWYPYAPGRADELKRHLVRTAIAAIDAVREVDPRARVMFPDPAVNYVPDPEHPERAQEAIDHTAGQYEAWDMLAGKMAPELGGGPECLDIVGVNYYRHNQWIQGKHMLPMRSPLYRPFREILAEIYQRYRRPIMIAETGTEGARRPGWLRYVSREVRAALAAGIPVHGITLYPIVDYPAWDDERQCPTGIWGYATPRGGRPVYAPLARELRRQQELFAEFFAANPMPGGPGAPPPGDVTLASGTATSRGDGVDEVGSRGAALPDQLAEQRRRWRHIGNFAEVVRDEPALRSRMTL